MTQGSLEKRVLAIEERNKKVEADKEWETSLFRRVSIATLTYLIIAGFLIATDNRRPFLAALVPATGYLLSTLIISPVKAWWLNK